TSPHLISHLFASSQLLLARLGARERTGPDIAIWYIGTHHNAGGRNLGANEPQRGWLGSLAKEAFAPPKHHWKSPHVVLVYQRCGLQRLNQIAAADDLQVGARLGLESGDCRDYIAVEQRRVVPVERRQCARSNMLFCRIECPRNRMVIGLVWPVRFEYLVGPATKYQLAILAVETCCRDVHAFVPIVEHPAAKGKTAGRVFFRSAGRLHDAVERHKRGCDEPSHGNTPVVFKRRLGHARFEDFTFNRGPPLRLQRCRSFSSASSHRTRAWRQRDRDRLSL